MIIPDAPTVRDDRRRVGLPTGQRRRRRRRTLPGSCRPVWVPRHHRHLPDRSTVRRYRPLDDRPMLATHLHRVPQGKLFPCSGHPPLAGRDGGPVPGQRVRVFKFTAHLSTRLGRVILVLVRPGLR